MKTGKIEIEIELRNLSQRQLIKLVEALDRIDKAIEYILKEYDTYNKGIVVVDQYDQPIYVNELYGELLNILKGSEE